MRNEQKQVSVHQMADMQSLFFEFLLLFSLILQLYQARLQVYMQ